MTRLRSLTLAQRVVIVIGLGVIFSIVGLYVATDGFVSNSGAWFAYAPGTDVYFSVRRPSAVRTLVAPIGLVVLWLLISVCLLATRPASGPSTLSQ